MHHWPVGHLFPQEPQLLSSLLRFVQIPLHRVSYCGQHPPLEQDCGEGQVCPHNPQLLLSFIRSLHPPEHGLNPAAQTQAPLLQDMPGGQWYPQYPQLFTSVAVSVQAPLQFTCPETLQAH